MGTLSLNPFDTAVYLVALIAVVMGFNAGLRSLPPDITDFIDRLKRERGI